MINVLSRPFKDLEGRKKTSDYITCEKPKPHTACDYGMLTGTPIYAPANMKVTGVNAANGEIWLDFTPHQDWDLKGKCIKLRTMVIAHCKGPYPKRHQVFKEGQEIAKSGSKGSSAPHLHISFHDVDEQTINPEAVLGFIMAAEDLVKAQKTIKSKTSTITNQSKEIKLLEKTVEGLGQEVDDLSRNNNLLNTELKLANEKIKAQTVKIANQKAENKKLQRALEDCKENKPQGCGIIFQPLFKILSKDERKS